MELVPKNNTAYTHLEGDPYAKNFVFKDIAHLSKSIIDYQESREGKDSEHIMETRSKIVQFSKTYLNKISPDMAPQMRENILEMMDTIEHSDPSETIVLMSAHQPNLFAYSGVLRKIALLKAVEKYMKNNVEHKKIICFYGFADHDFVNNKWVRSAEMPAPLNREGLLRFNVKLTDNELFMPTNKVNKPSIEKLESWQSQTKEWMSRNCSLAMKYSKSFGKDTGKNISEIAKNNFEEYWAYVEQAHGRATNLAEFSSFLLSAVVNNVLDTPVIFANFSDCYTIFGKEYEWLLANVSEYSSTIEANEKILQSNGIDSGLSADITELLPVWIKCTCGSKSKLSNTSTKFYAKCMHCAKESQYTKEELLSLVKTSQYLFEPRSISMPLAFAKAFDMSCYVGGVGGRGYLMHSKAISERLGLPFPVTPYWYVKDDYVSIDKLASCWETNRIASSYKLASKCVSHENLAVAAREASIELNEKMKDGVVPKSPVSERERQLLETIASSLNTPACSMHYAINVGMGSTYRQWIDFLASGGSLNETVKLESIASIPDNVKQVKTTKHITGMI